jgi:hypothetical protein
MNILYVTNHNKIASASGGFINDYLNDLIYYGLYELFGTNVIDSTPIISLYRENSSKIDSRMLWGGFTSFWLIEKDCVDRTFITEKIKSKYFDLIIYGSIRRCDDYYNLASLIYDSNKIILIDGNDDQGLSPLYQKHPYFKRELNHQSGNLLPISFSMPSNKITDIENQQKKSKMATVIPGIKETYIFTNESDYYQDYNNSFFGVTTKKAGWDCMRHYEILANYCVPYFANLSECPQFTMTMFPKKLLSESQVLFNQPNMNVGHYYDILNQLFDYTKKNLTTKDEARRLLEKVL